MTRTKKWDEMSRYEMVLARQVPEPEWYTAGLFGAYMSRSPKQTRSNIRLAYRSKQDKNTIDEFKKRFKCKKSNHLELLNTAINKRKKSTSTSTYN